MFFFFFFPCNIYICVKLQKGRSSLFFAFAVSFFEHDVLVQPVPLLAKVMELQQEKPNKKRGRETKGWEAIRNACSR